LLAARDEVATLARGYPALDLGLHLAEARACYPRHNLFADGLLLRV
jgi:hypothetical protein